MILSPALIAFKLKLMANQETKEIVLKFFFRGESLERFNARCLEFATAVIPGLIRPSAQLLLSAELAEKSKVAVVSASPENWVKLWCDALNIECLATRLEVIDQKITGKINGKNCNGVEKARRIKEAFSLDQFEKIIAYGDTQGDREMLQLAHEAHYREL